MAVDIISPSLRSGQVTAAIQSVNSSRKQMGSMEKELGLNLTNQRGGEIPTIASLIQDTESIFQTARANVAEAAADLIDAFTPYQIELYPGHPWWYGGITFDSTSQFTVTDINGNPLSMSFLTTGDRIRLFNSSQLDAADDNGSWTISTITGAGSNVVTISSSFGTLPGVDLDTVVHLVKYFDFDTQKVSGGYYADLDFILVGAVTETLTTAPLWGTAVCLTWQGDADVNSVTVYLNKSSIWTPTATGDDVTFSSVSLLSGDTISVTVASSASVSPKFKVILTP